MPTERDIIEDARQTALAQNAEQGLTTYDRRIFVRLNVSVPDGDIRSPEEIAFAILSAIEVGSDDDTTRGLLVAWSVAEELPA